MYERFSDRARKVMHLANQVAAKYNYDEVNVIHILVGITMERGGVAAKLLEGLKVEPAILETSLIELLSQGSGETAIGKLPLSSATKKMMDFAIEEATGEVRSSPLYIGTEHLFLAILREDAVAEKDKHWLAVRKVLDGHGLNYQLVRAEIAKVLPNAVQTQGLMDIFRLFNKETVQKIEEIVKVVDVDKVKKIFDAITVDDDGWVHVHLGVKK